MFAINHIRPELTEHSLAVSNFIQQHPDIQSNQDFNALCQGIVQSWKAEHSQEIARAERQQFEHYHQLLKSGQEGSFETSWGGVVVEHHEHPLVKKYLVVESGGYLALERHTRKEEEIEVREGLGILLQRSEAPDKLEATLLRPGEKFSFEPGKEHCVIALSDLLIYEVSQDHLGMDQDLVFLFLPAVD